ISAHLSLITNPRDSWPSLACVEQKHLEIVLIFADPLKVGVQQVEQLIVLRECSRRDLKTYRILLHPITGDGQVCCGRNGQRRKCLVICRFWRIEDSVRVAPDGGSGIRRRGFPTVVPDLRVLAHELTEAAHVLSTSSIERIVE